MENKYHIRRDKTIGVCRAKNGNCPYGKNDKFHFHSFEEGQIFLDRINELSCKCNVLSKHNESKDILKAKDVNKRLEKYKHKLNEIDNEADKKYKAKVREAKKQKRPNPYKPKFLEKFYKNNEDYHFYVNKVKSLETEVKTLIEERKQAQNFFNQFSAITIDSSYSNASSSSYAVYSGDDIEMIYNELNTQGYEVIMRPNANKKEFNIVRFSNHLPNKFLKSGESIENIWEKVDADVLVMYKNVNIDENECIHKKIDDFTKNKYYN